MTVALLIALLAKSSVVAGLGLGLSVLVARRAADRVDVLRATICLLLALPLFMAFGPALALSLLPVVQEVGPPPPLWSGAVQPVEGVTVSGALMQPSAGQLLTLAWSVGVLVVAIRFAAGIWTLSAWSRGGKPVEVPAWTAALQQVAPGARPVLKCSDRIASPLAWGLPPGTVLIDPETLARPHTAPAVMAHEMAHVRRGDWLFLLLARIALALFWFNPLVWLVHRSLIDRSEEAADAVAVAQVDRHAYARTLIGLAAGPGHPAATAMAGDGRSLKRRIATLMTEKTSARRPAVVVIAVAALTAVATPIAALELHARCADESIASAISQPLHALSRSALAATPMMTALSQDLAPRVPPVPPIPPAPPAALELTGWQAAPPAPPAPPAPSAMPAPPAPPAPPSFAPPPAPPAPPERSQLGRYVYIRDGVAQIRMSADEQARHEAARQAAAEARQAANEARIHADRRRSEAEAIRASAERARDGVLRARQIALAHASEGLRAAEHGRVSAAAAREQAQRARVDARAQMRNGAVQMRNGAAQMRQESSRLGDADYRARKIRENAAQGYRVTDAELRAMAPRLLSRAAELDRSADELAARGRTD